MSTILEIENLSRHFGGVAAVRDLWMSVDEREIRGVIGPNGAGKTTLFNLISGVLRPNNGHIRLRGEDITRMNTSEIAARGVVRTFQHDAVFHQFSTLDNVLLGRHLRATTSFWSTVLGDTGGVERGNRERAREIIDFIGLGRVADEPAGNLPHGYQRMLGVAIALATEPSVLMLDEPVAGMNANESEHMTELIRRLRDEWGTTVLLVEHDMRTVMGLCDSITVLNFGEKLAEGPPAAIREDKAVIEAYIGTDDLVA